MFCAAKASLLHVNASAEILISKKQGAVLSNFSKLVVKTGLVRDDLGRLLNRAQSDRHIADYTVQFFSAG
jgi:uncharacterized protein (UPF0332 family)